MMISINPNALLDLVESLFSPYYTDKEDVYSLYFPDRNTMLNFKEDMNEQIEKLSEFANVFGGGFLIDKSESVAQLTLFVGENEDLSILTKTFSINY